MQLINYYFLLSSIKSMDFNLSSNSTQFLSFHLLSRLSKCKYESGEVSQKYQGWDQSDLCSCSNFSDRFKTEKIAWHFTVTAELANS